MKTNLNKILRAKKITKYKLAKITGLSTSVIHHLSTGERPDITISTAYKICRALKIKFEELFYDR